ncbi:hypothetical protein [Phenylobacterium sp.]|uniref:hypothetical protein n=1 Tax=Phenylobacterium sp. TaxID=1871053 RepID=UPI002FD886A1
MAAPAAAASADSPLFIPRPAEPARRGGRGGLAGLVIALALAVAVAPGALWALGAYGWSYGLVNGATAQAALTWAPQIALASAATSVAALIAAALAGFRRFGGLALLAVLVSAVTLAILAGTGGLGV